MISTSSFKFIYGSNVIVCHQCDFEMMIAKYKKLVLSKNHELGSLFFFSLVKNEQFFFAFKFLYFYDIFSFNVVVYKLEKFFLFSILFFLFLSLSPFMVICVPLRYYYYVIIPVNKKPTSSLLINSIHRSSSSLSSSTKFQTLLSLVKMWKLEKSSLNRVTPVPSYVHIKL